MLNQPSRSIILLLFTLISSTGVSQDITNGNLNTWFLFFGREDISETWSFTQELHYRTGDFLSDPGQLLIRPSIDFHLNKEVEFSIGYTFVYVWPYSPYNQLANSIEHNIWWQAWIKNKVGSTILQHRFRQEHRWNENIQQVDDQIIRDGFNFSNRFRYRFVVIWDMIKLKKPGDAIILALFDEIWLEQNDNLLFTDLNRNWFYAGIGYKFSSDTNIQLAFLFQSDKISDGVFINSPVIQVGFFKSFPFGHGH